VLGVDPRLVLVFDFHATVDDAEFRRNDMVLLDGSDRHAVVAFADDPGMAIFLDRLSQYRGPIPDGQQAAPYQAFFDSIIEVRAYGPQDRITPRCASYIEQLTAPARLRLDVQCWYPASAELANSWLTDLRTAAQQAGGEVVSIYRNDAIEVMIARVYLPSDRLAEFAELDVIASIELLPTPELTKPELYHLGSNDLPAMVPPASNAPILGLVDSGVASAHPLLVGSIQAAESLSPHIADGEDRHGHGTMVASLALHGPIGNAIRQPRLLPIARVVSVAVLDSDLRFPDDSLWEQDLADAIEYCAAQGARVVNLSLGDPTRPFRPPRQHVISAIVDHLARVHDIVVVTATGNADPHVYLSSAEPERNYVADLLAHEDSSIIPPGTAALALTVGGINTTPTAGGYSSREPIERRPYGPVGWPSSVTRPGPGVERSIKPELVAASGTHGFEPGRRVLTDPELNVLGAVFGGATRLLGTDLGTSFAAPLVSRVALGVLARFPDFSANLTRALVLLGARPTWTDEDLEVSGSERPAAERRAAVRRLTGYGQTTLDQTLEVSAHRVVLVAEQKIEMDGVHVYELPIPSSFYQSGGKRYLDVALAFDPPTRSQRLDYLGNKIEFYVVIDITIEELLDVFTEVPTGQSEADDEPEVTTESAEEASSTAGIGEALGTRNVKFDLSVQDRSRSANQRGSRTFSQRLKQPANAGAYVVVRSVNRWCDETLVQPYGLAVSLRRDDDRTEIYNEVAAVLEAIIEVELRAEGEIET